ncbi:MAG: hypothetical protein HUK21_09870 [Fibrobacteraceae bacterium]|nr:hypothetical protein [Fibrobacteraceae bacterium]
MKFFNIGLLSLAFVFCSCDSHKVTVSFNTQTTPSQLFYLDAYLNAFVPADSASKSPESMETRLKVQTRSNLLMSYDDGSARFEMKIDSVDYQSNKRSVEEYRYMEHFLGTQSFQFKMASDGTVSDPTIEDSVIQFGSDDLNLIKLFLKIQPLLPGSPVAVGETWERPVEIPGKGVKTVVYKSFKLDDLFARDGAQLARINMNVKYKEYPDSTSDLHMESNGFIVGSGNVLFDVTHGVIMSASLDLSGTLTVRDVVSGDTIPDMHVVQKIQLKGELQ